MASSSHFTWSFSQRCSQAHKARKRPVSGYIPFIVHDSGFRTLVNKEYYSPEPIWTQYKLSKLVSPLEESLGDQLFTPCKDCYPLFKTSCSWKEKSCLINPNHEVQTFIHCGQGSTGPAGSVLLRGEVGSFIVNLSVGSHGATVRSVAPHRDLQSLRQFLGCQFGLQLLKLNMKQKESWHEKAGQQKPAALPLLLNSQQKYER